MARGAKSTRIKHITHRDMKLLRQLDRTGIAAADQAKIYCDISLERISKLEKSGFVTTSSHIVDGKNIMIIQLDDVGRDYCKDSFNTKYFYHTQITHLKHDLRLTEMYYNLKPEIQETWQHEKELVKEIYSKYPKMKNGNLKTCIDARVIVDGKMVAIEAIGASYTKKIIELKQDIAINLLQCERMETF